jgi:hypothetical protein
MKSIQRWAGRLLSYALMGAGVLSAASNGPVLVELFTSEGCSSCPPADLLLARLAQVPNVMVLSEHVDYWNSLGWADPFSAAQFSQRQQLYGRRFRLEGPYTPQMVVDGTAEFVGNNAAAADAAIREALHSGKVTVRVSFADAAARVLHIEADAPRKLSVMVALVTDEAVSKVPRGENGGRTLRHVSVVRRLINAGTTGEGGFHGDIPLPSDEQLLRQTDRVVVFVQESGLGRVSGAGSVPRPKAR